MIVVSWAEGAERSEEECHCRGGSAGQTESGSSVVAAVSHLAGQLLVLLHQLLVLLVDGQHLADTVGSCLSLTGRAATADYLTFARRCRDVTMTACRLFEMT